MRLEAPARLDWAEALRYMGSFEEPDESLTTRLETCQAKVLAAARPVGWWARFERGQAPAGLLLDTGDIARHLEGCGGFVLLGVSLGAGVDTLLRRLSATDLFEAALCDALASTLAEAMAAQAESAVRLALDKEGLYCTGRYSPGYGDWPLAAQPVLCRMLDAQRRLGVCCSASCLLAPRKSVTALMGVSDHPVQGKLAGCGHCVLNKTCTYRKRGKTCADY